ncbi:MULTISPECIES: winged helix-turn-helix transcriptional regulator [unclassified Sphingobium]|uniref:winged helix-turn-helix transcriptional regulator n=1 Tax=unclassified Sphingobium TaxID=2611147 RepID=UPI000D152311|nr:MULTISPECIES: helix-turn-helix domain-containing protein [unclassified Sphingobium]MBG6118653.1 DNA-binding HxlR family transcriptional regulator [Sphingobium sp. JAI105]PSO13664.1 transcriptional regulator [Sphingobium sp. AEW4]TWD10666.1 HxlR family transcriptional regulator [Sphingobium sp. AEW010]TWD27929.1 HxlR family transcriptional regulator [Sphingobium sp. AEW013]TWD29000.1 HxlR family transcriptional regulator [Sphingobium sp. AEW001]
MPSFRSGCPIASALDLIGDKWTLVILRSMVMGASSYSDFLSAPERISTNILAERLRRMEAAGLVEQRATRRGASRGVYALSRKGAALLPTIQELARWGEQHIPDRWHAPEEFYAARPEQLAR